MELRWLLFFVLMNCIFFLAGYLVGAARTLHRTRRRQQLEKASAAFMGNISTRAGSPLHNHGDLDFIEDPGLKP